MLFIQFRELIERYNYFLLDAHGVFWGSTAEGILPGSKEAMQLLVSLGKQVGILSNATQVASKQKEKLAKYGIVEGIHYHFLLTSGEVARRAVLSEDLPFPTPRKTYAVFGPKHPWLLPHLTIFKDSTYQEVTDMKEADFVYIGVPHVNGVDQKDPSIFMNQIRAFAAQKIPIFCVNPDKFTPEGSPPRLVVRQGAIANLLQKEGASVHFIGKPFPLIFKKGLALFSKPVLPEEVLMIGDTPETDVRGGRQMGLSTALIVKTGVMGERQRGNCLNTILEQLPPGDTPDYILERLFC